MPIEVIRVVFDLRTTIIGDNHLDTHVASCHVLENPIVCHGVFMYTPIYIAFI